MKKIIINNTYEIIILIISCLLYLVFKEFPYFNILVSTEMFFVLIWIETTVLFKLTSDKTLRVSLYLFLGTLVSAVLGLSLTAMMSISALSLFIFGSLQHLWEMLVKKRKER